jgi:glycosyltransferase involved in cell wall biosynthesis
MESIMSQKLPKSKSVDIMIVSEGTYPYVRGGVSSWIQQLITGLSEYSFGIIFIGSKADDYDEVKYEFPANLKHIEAHYLFDEKKNLPKKVKADKSAFKLLESFYANMNKDDFKLPSELKDIDFFLKRVRSKDFLYSKESWNFMKNIYESKSLDIPFVDYFWTVRNIHAPIWKLATIVKNMPKTKIIHSPSTGYAGFLSFMASNDKNIPFLLTEHGIYTRERKIDMLAAKWVSYHSPALLQDEPQEMNYVKQMWVSFFEKIGLLSYSQATKVISLYPGARELQLQYGAKEDKSIVIPNGVDIPRFTKLFEKRTDDIPKVITLLGRVVSIKDIKTFIRSIAIVKNTIPDIEAWVVGDMDEEPIYAKECQELSSSFNLDKNLKFLGFKNIDEILPKSGLLTLTSISEGMPLVVLEGFAAGIPCVSTDVGSCHDLIYGALDEEDKNIGQAGEVTPIANPVKLAEAYIKFLSDEKLWLQAQSNALTRVKKYYQQTQFLDSYKKLYEKEL